MPSGYSAAAWIVQMVDLPPACLQNPGGDAASHDEYPVSRLKEPDNKIRHVVSPPAFCVAVDAVVLSARHKYDFIPSLAGGDSTGLFESAAV
jgi:hypothetical protein